MRLLTDGAEAGYALSGLQQLDGNKATQSDNPRTGNYCFRVSNQDADSAWQLTFDEAKTEVYLRHPFSVDGWTSELDDDHAIVAWFNESTKMGRVRLKGINEGLFRLDIIIGTEVVATSSDVISVDQYHAAETKILIDGTEGEISVFIDGRETVSYTGDTTYDGNSDYNKVRFGGAPPHTTNTIHLDFDDLAINDSEGDEDNSWCGDAKIVAVFPNADGEYSEWTPEPTGSLWSTVDEVPPNASDYVYTDQELALVSFEKTALGLPSSAMIQRIILSAYAVEMTEESSVIKFLLRKASEDYISSIEHDLATTFQMVVEEFKVSPFTLASWTLAEFDSIEIGAST